MQNQWKNAEAEWARALAQKPDFDEVRKDLEIVRRKMGTI